MYNYLSVYLYSELCHAQKYRVPDCYLFSTGWRNKYKDKYFLTVCARRKEVVVTPASILWSATTSRTGGSVLFYLEHCTVSCYYHILKTPQNTLVELLRLHTAQHSSTVWLDSHQHSVAVVHLNIFLNVS